MFYPCYRTGVVVVVSLYAFLSSALDKFIAGKIISYYRPIDKKILFWYINHNTPREGVVRRHPLIFFPVDVLNS